MEDRHGIPSKHAAGKKRPPKAKPLNPIENAIKSWFSTLPAELSNSITLIIDNLLATAPKRWTVYQPMVLLPSGSFTSSSWSTTLSSIPSTQLTNLWTLILYEIGKREGKGKPTHLTVNSGIPLTKTHEEENENILRTPSGLIMLHGDFGPELSPDQEPSAQDFTDAFWVSTKQNGITQVWAPRYTMFSRGNIKEKARLLEFHQSTSEKWPLRKVGLNVVKEGVAVDLYAGIGYFVFSYVAMGMGRVVGWELNPWSVEGLRRGAIADRWAIKIVKTGEDVVIGTEKILIFQEDNRLVEERLRDEGVRELLHRKTLHVNCGLLPTSLPVWKTALELLGSTGWLHLHENVGVDDIPSRSRDIEGLLNQWESSTDRSRPAKVEHVELVKTFAPGVWHCVFDVFISGTG